MGSSVSNFEFSFIFEVIPHPRYQGEWLLKPTRGAPFGLWYRDRAHAVSYAEWVARVRSIAATFASREQAVKNRR